MDLKKLVITSNSDLKKALKLIDLNALGLLFVVNKKNKIVGVITDGDIRRHILNDNDLAVNVNMVMNKNFISLPISTTNSKIIEHFNKKIKIIPLINDVGAIVDYASINRLKKISISSPLLKGNELLYLTECLDTNWISSQGRFVKLFEKNFKDYHENCEALAVSNGTVALHLALVALGIGKGDEVILPNLTFAASINAVLYSGATPVLVDVEYDTFNIDVNKIKDSITTSTKAIMPVHLYGQPCDMKSILEISKKHNLLIVEDCAEALGSKYDKRPVGVFGDAATFSFFGNKTITTGEGGMIIFKDHKIAEKAAVLRDHGMSKTKRYWHDFVGYNYRLTNMQAAIGVAQFERLRFFIDAKRDLSKTYNKTLNKFNFFQTPIEKEGTYNSYWLYTFLVKDNAPFKREELISYLNTIGIDTRPVFYPLHVMPPYKLYGEKVNLKTSEFISARGVSLPSSVSLSKSEIKFICSKIVEFIQAKL